MNIYSALVLETQAAFREQDLCGRDVFCSICEFAQFGQLGRSSSAFAPQPVKFHQAYILPEMEEQWTLLDTAYAANRMELALEMENEVLQELVDHMDKIPR